MALPPKKPTSSTTGPTTAIGTVPGAAPGIAPGMPGIGGSVAPGQKAPGYVPPLGPSAIGGSMASKPPTTSTARPTPAPTPLAGKYKPFVR